MLTLATDLPRARLPRGALVQLGLQPGVDGRAPQAARLQVDAAAPTRQPLSKVIRQYTLLSPIFSESTAP
jgi:hypothetical protein